MNAVASLRQSITHHQLLRDSKAEQLCSDLLLDIVKSMRIRYMDECTRKEKASFDAYEDDEAVPEKVEESETKVEPPGAGTNEGNSEDLHSQVIEKLILGGDVLPKNDADFVAFSPGHASDPSKLLVSPMGWAHYKGLGAALNRCYREEPSAKTTEEKATLVLSSLGPYADSWDRIQIQDAAEAELVDLFDESLHLGSSSKALIEDFNAQSKASEKKSAGPKSRAVVDSF